MSDLSAAFRKPFAQQVAAFRIRLADLRATTGWKDVWQAEHDRAFMVAGAQKAELLADLAAAVDKAISQGTTLEEFRQDFDKAVADHNWHGWAGEETEKGRAWRTRVIYGTNLSTSYAAGRHAQLKAGGFKFWVYRHGNSREPRKQHLGWNGLILPPDHPFWEAHYPPNGWGCSCYVIGANSMASAVRRGGNADLKLPDNWRDLDPKTGAPFGIDKGWAYAPGRSVASTVTILAEKLAALPAPVAADLVGTWPDRIFEAWSEEFATFVDTVSVGMKRGRMMPVGALKPEWVKATAEAGEPAAGSEIVVLEDDVRHTFRLSKTDQLDPDWYRQLPLHLRHPDAVILDTVTPGRPALILIYGKGKDVPKLVLKINYRTGKFGTVNLVKTGKLVDTFGVTEGPGLKLIEGQL